MKKTLAILSIFLLALMSMATATLDVSVASISISPSNPYDGQAITVDVIVSNEGNETFPQAIDALHLDLDDTTTQDATIPELAVGASETISFTHTYTTHGNYNLIATYTAGDDNASNDMATTTLTVAESIQDVSVTSITSSPNQPIEATDTVTFLVTVENTGNQDLSAMSNALSLDFDDGSAVATKNIPALAVGASETLTFTHTYDASGSYTPIATYTTGDDNAGNDDESTSVNVVAKSYNINNPTVSYTILRGNTASANINFESSSNVAMDVDLAMQGDLVLTGNPSEIISGSSISISPSSFNLGAGDTRSATFYVAQIETDVAIGTYTGQYIIAYGEAGELSKTGTVRIVVQNNAPNIAPIANQQMLVGQEFTYAVSASDVEENNDLVYGITGVPGMTIDNSTGVISWIPGGVYSGTATVSVSDSHTSVSESFGVEAKIDMAQLTFSSEQIDLGSSSTNRGDAVATTLQIQNTGTRTITNLAVDITDARGRTIDEDYNAIVSINKNTLAPGEQATVTISLNVPEDAHARPTKIAEVTVSGLDGGNNVEDEVPVYLEAESHLVIEDVDIEVNRKDEGSLDDGDNFDELFEGDEVKLTITLQNTYSDDDDEIEDAYVEVTDDNWDIDEASDKQDIDGDDGEATFTITFTIDDEIEDDITSLLIKAYGEDNREDIASFNHYDEWEIQFEIDRKDDDIRIKDITFDRNPVDCTANSVTMDVTLRNYGLDDQDEIFIYAYSDKSELDWNEKKTYISLDTGEETTRSFNIDLPNNLDENTYIVTVEVKYDISKDADEEMALLDVVCYNDVPEEDTGDEDVDEEDELIIDVDDQLDNGDGDGSLTGNVVYGQPKTGFEEFTESTAYLVLLAVLSITILGVIVVWLGKAFAKA